MKRLALGVLFLLAALVPASAGDWNEAKSTHFVVYYHNAPADFCQKVLQEAERNYEKITDDLGFLRFDFWLWDNRARIYIYDDAGQYRAESGMPAWSGGAALPRDKVINAYYGIDGFFERVLPHEIGHIIFREFVGFDNPSVPLWLDEGAASYQERSAAALRMLPELVRSGRVIPLRQLSMMQPHAMTDGGQVRQFYVEAVGIIDYLIRSQGKETFVFFCRSLRDMKEFDKALSYAYSIRGADELEKRWMAELKNE